MRYFYPVVFFCFVFLASCRVDEFSPCDKQEGMEGLLCSMEGLLCKEIRFENSVSIGYLAYYYNPEKLLSRKDYKSIEGQLKKYDTFTYENGKLSQEDSYDENGELLAQKKYFYNDLLNLSAVYFIENGVEVSYKTYEYADSLLAKESTFSYNELENYTIYQYYNGETRLYRRSLYSAAGELLSYTEFEYFVNNFERHDHYTGSHAFTGYDVIILDENGNQIRSSVYNVEGTVISWIEYTYNQYGQLDTSSEYDEDGKLRKNTKFIYYN
jgi:hypothetical protein